ncbi:MULTISPECIES: HAL/PAL/TAL family ammonia-lyase [Halorussus]|uniref:HAL/PAL/TAL family ammonia-lyase n=1 Tax=Halorussus TaxID=1070314 RepID=UPI0020A0B2D6|nr:aromatic amino acid ammonia-lyase [Halorussus vallis]USZ74290.1 aromatic amino acid ammonia-lyase [Halorussus vallis]
MVRLTGELTIDDVVAVARGREPVRLPPETRDRIVASRDAVDDIVDGDRRVYGVNTGFGDLQNVSISRDDLDELQENLLRSHATAVGDPLPTDVVRAAMLARANALAVGASGVRVELVEKLVELLNEGVHPVVPADGSTDDLGAAAHIGLVLMGEGEVERLPPRESRSDERRTDRRRNESRRSDERDHRRSSERRGDRGVDAAVALSEAGVDPLEPKAKEGLAVVSGTPITTGLLALGVHDTERLVRTADLAGAWTFELLGEAPTAFAERVTEVRPYEGHAESAANVRRLVGATPDGDHEMTQDPLSLRCIPQVHGALREQLAFARRVVETELASATDNPLVFPDGETFSCGNFNGQQMAGAADMLRTAVQKVGRVSERRANKLVSDVDGDGVAAFLAANPGLESGMMIGHYTATGLAAELETRTSASGRSVTVSGGQEDVHSLGTLAARHLAEAVEAVRRIVAVELLCASRRTELAGTELPDALAAVAADLDEAVGLPLADTSLHEEIRETAELVADGRFAETAETAGADLV